MKPKSKILIIAGSDSSGGAGIQADIKTVTSLGAYAMTAITALTIQNTFWNNPLLVSLIGSRANEPALDAKINQGGQGKNFFQKNLQYF